MNEQKTIDNLISMKTEIEYESDDTKQMKRIKCETIKNAIKALEKQQKIKKIIANANQWSKEDVVVKAQAFCDIEKILRSDEE